MKTACRLSEPTGKVVVAIDAVPSPATATGVPMLVEPTSNWTVPGAAGVTVAFSVTDVPATWGLDWVVVSMVAVEVSAGAG